MRPLVRKLALTTHVTSSVGWLGAVAAFFALAVTGLTTDDLAMARGAYLAMELVAWAIIVPFGLASLLSGLIQGLGTSWGLFRHYWVVIKLVLTVLATAILLLHMHPIGHLARAAEEARLSGGELAGLRIQLVADAGAALLVLAVNTALSVLKPRGMTRYGRRKLREERGAAQ